MPVRSECTLSQECFFSKLLPNRGQNLSRPASTMPPRVQMRLLTGSRPPQCLQYSTISPMSPAPSAAQDMPHHTRAWGVRALLQALAYIDTNIFTSGGACHGGQNSSYTDAEVFLASLSSREMVVEKTETAVLESLAAITSTMFTSDRRTRESSWAVVQWLDPEFPLLLQRGGEGRAARVDRWDIQPDVGRCMS